MSEAPTVRWTELTDPELEAARDAGSLVLVPLGAVEQHGPHLPCGTDASIAETVAEHVARRLGGTLVAPGPAWGYSATHMSFASTISLRPQTMLSILHDVCGSIVAHGFEKLAIVCSHATNRPVGQLFIQEFAAAHGVTVAFIHYTDFAREAFREARQTEIGGEMHAGEFETSMQLYLRPDLVKADREVAECVDPNHHFGISSAARDFTQGGNVTLPYDIKKLFPSGVMGDARPATRELGEQMFTTIVAGIAAVLEEYRSFDYADRAALSVAVAPDSWARRD
jgi:creatinine amidohydrolase